MTDLPFAGGADTTVGPVPGYYADPSIPGFVRYWGGSAWVPGTTRPTPAEGEVLEPPRFLNRPARAPGARYVPPPVVTGAGADAAAEPGRAAGPWSGAGSAAGRDGAGVFGGAPEGAFGGTAGVAVGPGETGPVYLDQTMAGTSFTMAPQAELELRRRAEVEARAQAQLPVQQQSPPERIGWHGPRGGDLRSPDGPDGPDGPEAGDAGVVAEATAAAESAGPEAPSFAVPSGSVPSGAVPSGLVPSIPAPALRAAPAGTVATPGPGIGGEEAPVESERRPLASGWQVDPRAQRGLLETGGSPRWVSWGVLPGSSEAQPAPAASTAAEQAGAAAPEPARSAAEGPGARAVATSSVSVAASAGTSSPKARPAGASAATSSAATSSAAPSEALAGRATGRGTTDRGTAESGTADRGAGERTPGGGRAAVRAVGGQRTPERAPGGRRTTDRRSAAAPAPAPAAGLGRRLLARVLDTAVMAVVAAAAGVPLASSAMAHIDDKLDRAAETSSLAGQQVQVWLVDGVVVGKAAALLAVLVLAGFLFEVLPTARTGQTFGKRVLGIRVVDAGAKSSVSARSTARSGAGVADPGPARPCGPGRRRWAARSCDGSSGSCRRWR